MTVEVPQAERLKLTGGKQKVVKDEIMKLPIARFTFANYLGRNLYTISGVIGLFWLKGDKDSHEVPVVAARRQSARGGGWVGSYFIRNKEVEERLKL